MSSFDPDDTTPLINPQDPNQNHGTFNGNQEQDDEPLDTRRTQQGMADDEMLDGRTTSGTQRFNPFDRVPNLPPQLADELNAGIVEPESRWTRFKRCEIYIFYMYIKLMLLLTETLTSISDFSASIVRQLVMMCRFSMMVLLMLISL
jgi:hypothetical protein